MKSFVQFAIISMFLALPVRAAPAQFEVSNVAFRLPPGGGIPLRHRAEPKLADPKLPGPKLPGPNLPEPNLVEPELIEPKSEQPTATKPRIQMHTKGVTASFPISAPAPRWQARTTTTFDGPKRLRTPIATARPLNGVPTQGDLKATLWQETALAEDGFSTVTMRLLGGVNNIVLDQSGAVKDANYSLRFEFVAHFARGQ